VYGIPIVVLGMVGGSTTTSAFLFSKLHVKAEQFKCFSTREESLVEGSK
jgi:hypothetical protein